MMVPLPYDVLIIQNVLRVDCAESLTQAGIEVSCEVTELGWVSD